MFAFMTNVSAALKITGAAVPVKIALVKLINGFTLKVVMTVVVTRAIITSENSHVAIMTGSVVWPTVKVCAHIWRSVYGASCVSYRAHRRFLLERNSTTLERIGTEEG